MSQTITSISMSLDGYIAGEDISAEMPMGKEGARLHDWIFNSKTASDTLVMAEIHETSGAVIVGANTYKTAIENAWKGESPFSVTAYVITHDVPEEKVAGFEYITGGIESALIAAKSSAEDKDIWIMGGADIIQQFINAGALDIIQINLVNILMGQGKRLFENLVIPQTELEIIRDIDSIGVTHLKYRILR